MGHYVEVGQPVCGSSQTKDAVRSAKRAHKDAKRVAKSRAKEAKRRKRARKAAEHALIALCERAEETPDYDCDTVAAARTLLQCAGLLVQ